MRIAVSGSHATGKSTLVRELAVRLPGATAVDETYHLLADEGHAFGDPPTTDDFELLFERSVSALAASHSGSVIFDRSPADYLAYLAVLRPGEALADRLTTTAAALASLDLVVYVPIENPDRIGGAEATRLRRRVDAVLREMLMSEAWGVSVPVLEVAGTPSARVNTVAAHLATITC